MCALICSGMSGLGGFSGRSPDSDISDVGRLPTLGLLCKFEAPFPLLSMDVLKAAFAPRTCIILTCCLSTEYMCALSSVKGCIGHLNVIFFLNM